MSKAIIVRIDGIEKHPNADNLMLAKVLGCQVIVGKNQRVGDIVVLFPTELALSVDMCQNNQLYRKDPETGERNNKGYLDQNGRIKVLKLRGQNSEGLVLPLSSLDWAGNNKLKIGDEFDTINKQKICEKYINRATRNAMNRAAKKYRKPWWVPKYLVKYHKKYVVNRVGFDPLNGKFPKHFDTNKLRLNLHNIPENSFVHISSKRHGTSQRFGYIQYNSSNWISRILKLKGKYRYISGTRNVTKHPDFHKGKDDGYYGGTDFRGDIHKDLMGRGVKKDEILYFEVLGYVGSATKIMPDHPIKKSDFKDAGFSSDDIKKIITQYGETITYTYGCEPGQYTLNVYRITQDGKDLSKDEVESRCGSLGLKPVKHLKTVTGFSDLMEEAKLLSDVEDMDGQLREGVCLRFEDCNGKLLKVMKYKSFIFCVLESIKNNETNYVDMETVS